MKRIFNYNADLNSGYIISTVYPKGYVFEGAALKPTLTFGYESFIFDDFNKAYTVTINGTTTDMTVEQKLEFTNACTTWTDTTYITAERTFEILQSERLLAFKQMFLTNVSTMSDGTSSDEMASWLKQEAQARAWKAYDPTPVAADVVTVIPATYDANGVELTAETTTTTSELVIPTAPLTPIIDAIIAGRAITGETKDTFTALVIEKADAYEYNYGLLLGKWHSKQLEVMSATTVDELNAISA